jgi:hypothetical protein
MKTKLKVFARLWLTTAFCLSLSSQSYSVDWCKIAGGCGTGTGGSYRVTGTIGQRETGGALSGGRYSVTGGFWSLVSVAQTTGLPNLSITLAGGRVIVWWPTTDNCSLQQNNNLSGDNWVMYGYPVTTNNGNCCITINPPAGNLFFRLARKVRNLNQSSHFNFCQISF